MIPSKTNPPTYEQFVLLLEATMKADGRIINLLTNLSENLKRNQISVSSVTNELDKLCDELMDSIQRRQKAIN